ncbi:antifreeze protein [Mycena rosella]|uniref:Antifreeze protein n=1 Tax=Mycena rosella TaxID=1033263 RepID=A0AAD7G4L2_MYCRO|nr:antifreeze protein [Mycena rosella]
MTTAYHRVLLPIPLGLSACQGRRYFRPMAMAQPFEAARVFSFNPVSSSTPQLSLSHIITMISSLFTIVVAVGPAAVNLRTAANYAILAQTGVSTLPPSVITGAVAVSPIAANAITGFSLILDSTGCREIFAASYAIPTPATLTVAVGDMGTAFNDATGRSSPNFTNLATGAIGGLVLVPGLYKWTSAVTVGNNITISGTASDTWLFQVTGTLSVVANAKMVLTGGAVATNIVWVVTGAVTAAAGSHLEGVVLGKTSITLQTGATANSRLLAQTAVALQKVWVIPKPSV